MANQLVASGAKLISSFFYYHTILLCSPRGRGHCGWRHRWVGRGAKLMFHSTAIPLYCYTAYHTYYLIYYPRRRGIGGWRTDWLSMAPTLETTGLLHHCTLHYSTHPYYAHTRRSSRSWSKVAPNLCEDAPN